MIPINTVPINMIPINTVSHNKKSLTSTVHTSPSCGFQASPVSPQVTS